MKVECFTVGAFSVNTYLLTDEASQLSAIVDTGETEELVWRLKDRSDVHIAMILLTHAHLDHAGALTYLQKQFEQPKQICTSICNSTYMSNGKILVRNGRTIIQTIIL